MTYNRDAFHREAIQTQSHDEVTAMRELLVETLVEEGHDPEIDEEGNVLATRGTDDTNGTHLVLNTHIDTVPPHVPYERDGDTVRGRGSCDAKGPLAALLDAFFAATIDDGQLTLAVTPDEETAQFGGTHLGDTLSADGYIVGEPTDLDVCHAARGSFGGHVTIRGESAHASDPTEGSNPIRAIGPLVDALEQYDEQCGPGEHDVLGLPTLTPTRIDGGGPLNQTPTECTVSFDRRSVPPETSEQFFDSLQSYLDVRLPDVYGISVRPAYPDSPDPEAYATDTEAPLVRTLADVSGGKIRAFGAATEASYFADDAPTVVFGPGVLADEDGPVAHADREYVTQSAVADASDAVRTTVERHL
ncbi:M20/M25/M40 family metallo-hydrolase [Halobacterium salinarum]|uniref:M20/M25/M40 family metallo-hydrolase n=1 Tax=Halobacterium salinarum TaxID=2242 RepID=UPI0025567EDE|nr:M20/M25/M40 family metallo-hydrolase [Halobacterium salinarum]MDL0138600.1 M20/M25/M40 family metallo-hydrolase [Halobacterium salinarum]